MLLKHRLALTVNIISGVIAGVLSTGNDGILTASMFHILLMSLFGGAAAVYLSRRSVRRSVLLYAGFGVAVVNFLTMLSAGVLTSTNMQSTFISAAYGAGGGAALRRAGRGRDAADGERIQPRHPAGAA